MEVHSIAAAIERGERVVVIVDSREIATDRIAAIRKSVTSPLLRCRAAEMIEVGSGGKAWFVTPRQTNVGRGMMIDRLIVEANNVPERMLLALRAAVRP